jgi:hypothetical protein
MSLTTTKDWLASQDLSDRLNAALLIYAQGITAAGIGGNTKAYVLAQAVIYNIAKLPTIVNAWRRILLAREASMRNATEQEMTDALITEKSDALWWHAEVIDAVLAV